MITIQNQSVESFHRAVGLQPPPPFPTYSHPYHSTPTSPPRAQATETPAARSQAPFVTPEELLASLSSALDPTVSAPSFTAVVELVSDMATSSGSQPVVEDAPIGHVTTVTPSEPLRLDSSSEEDTDETIVADPAAPVVVSTTVPTTLVEPVPAPAEPESSLPEAVTTSTELAPPADAPAPTSPTPATETADDSTQA